MVSATGGDLAQRRVWVPGLPLQILQQFLLRYTDLMPKEAACGPCDSVAMYVTGWPITCCQLSAEASTLLSQACSSSLKEFLPQSHTVLWGWLIDSAAGADLEIVLSLLALGLFLRQLKRQSGGLRLSILKTLKWPICTVFRWVSEVLTEDSSGRREGRREARFR